MIVVDAGALGRAVDRGHGRPVPVEPSPRNALGVEKIADIESGHLDSRACGTIVGGGVDIGDDRSVRYLSRDGLSGVLMSLTRNQVEVAHHGRTPGSREEVVAHGEALRVVPKRRNRIAVVITH